MDGDDDNRTDNVGVDRAVKAGDTLTGTTGVEAGELSITIGESKHVGGFLSGVTGITAGVRPISAAIPWSSTTSGGVSFTTTLWSSPGSTGGVAGREPRREGGAIRLGWPGVGILRVLRIRCTCTSMVPFLPWGRHPIGFCRWGTGGQQFPGSLLCLFLMKLASRGRVRNSLLCCQEAWCWFYQCWRKPCGLGVCHEHPGRGHIAEYSLRGSCASVLSLRVMAPWMDSCSPGRPQSQSFVTSVLAWLQAANRNPSISQPINFSSVYLFLLSNQNLRAAPQQFNLFISS